MSRRQEQKRVESVSASAYEMNTRATAHNNNNKATTIRSLLPNVDVHQTFIAIAGVLSPLVIFLFHAAAAGAQNSYKFMYDACIEDTTVTCPCQNHLKSCCRYCFPSYQCCFRRCCCCRRHRFFPCSIPLRITALTLVRQKMEPFSFFSATALCHSPFKTGIPV